VRHFSYADWVAAGPPCRESALVAIVIRLIAVVIAVVVMVPHVAALANFFELTTALLRLLAALAVLADVLLQVLFGLADVIAALVIAVGAGGRRHSSQ
jgi:hypothetical protein